MQNITTLTGNADFHTAKGRDVRKSAQILSELLGPNPVPRELVIERLARQFQLLGGSGRLTCMPAQSLCQDRPFDLRHLLDKPQSDLSRRIMVDPERKSHCRRHQGPRIAGPVLRHQFRNHHRSDLRRVKPGLLTGLIDIMTEQHRNILAPLRK